MILPIIGLSLNFVGTILVAFSIKKGDVEAWQDDSNKREFMTVHKQSLFRFGIGILALGFAIQIYHQIFVVNC